MTTPQEAAITGAGVVIAGIAKRLQAEKEAAKPKPAGKRRVDQKDGALKTR